MESPEQRHGNPLDLSRLTLRLAASKRPQLSHADLQLLQSVAKEVSLLRSKVVQHQQANEHEQAAQPPKPTEAKRISDSGSDAPERLHLDELDVEALSTMTADGLRQLHLDFLKDAALMLAHIDDEVVPMAADLARATRAHARQLVGALALNEPAWCEASSSPLVPVRAQAMAAAALGIAADAVLPHLDEGAAGGACAAVVALALNSHHQLLLARAAAPPLGRPCPRAADVAPGSGGAAPAGDSAAGPPGGETCACAGPSADAATCASAADAGAAAAGADASATGAGACDPQPQPCAEAAAIHLGLLVARLPPLALATLLVRSFPYWPSSALGEALLEAWAASASHADVAGACAAGPAPAAAASSCTTSGASGGSGA